MTEAEFWSHVEKTDGCWIWTGARNNSGYGSLYYEKRYQLAHRVAWRLANGPIPDGLHILHSCDNRPCVNNVDHLFSGTRADNVADMIAKGRNATGDRHGLIKHPERIAREFKRWNCKLSDEQVAQIQQRRKMGTHVRVLAEIFAVSQAHIYAIADGTRRQAR